MTGYRLVVLDAVVRDVGTAEALLAEPAAVLEPRLEGLVEELGERWPGHDRSPWAAWPPRPCAGGRGCVVELSLESAVSGVEAVVAVAQVRGLAVYDPQAGQLVPLPVEPRRRWWRRAGSARSPAGE